MKITILLLIITGYINLLQGQNNQTYKLIIGTLTNSSQAEGIHVYDFDSRTGDFTFKTKAGGIDNPSYLTVSHDGKNIYSVNEVRTGGISAFGFNPISGELTFLNRINSNGDGPCYIEVDDKKKYVFVGHYGSGNLCAVSLNENGSLNANIQCIQNAGSSINSNRQKGPHVHSVVLSPDNNFLLSADLGTDKVNIYKFDRINESQPLTPYKPAFISVKAGSGPRHITFHPTSKFVYVIQEMEGMITVFDYKRGKLYEKQAVNMVSPDFEGRIGAADIHVSPDGRFLYGSNRGTANEIVIYFIDKNGKLEYAGRQGTLGIMPRNFVIDPTGNFLLVANQQSNDIIIFKRDQISGLLTPTQNKIQVSRPVCLKFVL